MQTTYFSNLKCKIRIYRVSSKATKLFLKVIKATSIMDSDMPYFPQKMHMHPCMRAYATVQKLLCHGNYCVLILSPVRASFRLSFAARPAVGSTKSAA